MNRAQLFDAFRSRSHDIAAPYLWSDDELQEYLDDAENEATERALLLRDSETPEICEVVIAAGIATYALDSRVLEVLRAKLDIHIRPLGLTTTEGLDRDWPAWDVEVAGEPKCLAIDALGAEWQARLVPPPSVATVLRLHVYRLPLTPLGSDKCAPEIHPRLHIKLLDWMCYRAYSKHDAETKNDEKAMNYAAAFAANFGPKHDAKANRAQHDMQFPFVRPIGL